MNAAISSNAKKLARSLQVFFPVLLDAKFDLMRWYRNLTKRPFENDFNALSLFPDLAGALFLDVGANRGQSTDAILMKQKNARIQMFEPNRLLFRKLENTYGGNPAVVLSNFGLGDENIEGSLYIPTYRKWMFDGLASFDQQAATSWLRDGQLFFYDERHLSIQSTTCPIRRLDDLNLDPHFIKLDIQGFEYKALKGGEATIRAHQPVLLIETPDRNVVDFLAGLGYEYYAFRTGKFVRGVTGALNTFFMTADKARLVERHILDSPVEKDGGN